MSNNYRYARPTIGVLIGWHVNWTPSSYSYLSGIFRGINAAVDYQGCNLLLASGMGSGFAHRPNMAHPAWPVVEANVDFVPVGPRNTDGLIVVNPLSTSALSKHIHAFREAGHPVVFIAGGEGEPVIQADNAGGIFQAIEHLVAHGHQSIAYIAGNSSDPKGDSGDRLRAYRAALRHFELDPDPGLFAYGYHVFKGGYEAMRQILASRAAFTAVLANNDESAMGAMQALKEAGLQVPQDVAVVGFDDRPEIVALEPPLTSVHVPLYKLGYQAVEMLLRQIRGEQDAARSLTVPTYLAIRRSCGCDFDARTVVAAGSAPGFAGHKADIVRAMVEAVLAETQALDIDEVEMSSERLVDAFVVSLEQEDPAGFRQLLEKLLGRTETDDDDAHIWQGVISILRQELPALVEAAHRPAARQLGLDMLDRARNAVSERMRRQRSQAVLDQKWLVNRIAYLTSSLQLTSDNAQIFEVLAKDLPAIGIQRTSMSFFEPDGDDPVGWSVLHAIQDDKIPPLRFRTREFPPDGLYPSGQRFSLALLPLVGPAGQIGFIAYDSTNIELDGPITQQITAALNNARLYAEATEGRILAEEANNMKSRFLSTVSHELRTPLNLIAGLSEILLLDRDPGERPLSAPRQRDLEQIYASAQHLGRLIGDVLDLASSQVGQLRLANELLDLNETLRMVVATGRQLATDKGLAWREALPVGPLQIWGDRTRLRQVALNLVSNAVKFTSRGEVGLQVEVREGWAVVLVSDTGPGIAAAEQGLIFDEFRRSELTTTRGYGGLGLGLAISKRLVEMHGGEIGVRSLGDEGAGSTFYFTLPLIEPGSIRTGDPALPLGSQETVLLLTNQSGSGEQLREHLAQWGFEVNMVYIDGEDNWLSPVLLDPPGAVVLDMAIAPTQGWDILKRLKENAATRSIPMLFYSLNDDKGTMLELDTLTKPIGAAELDNALEEQKPATDDGKTEKVFLIVDDDPATLEMHARIVQSHPGMHRVLKARNGREALELMQQQRPDLVLLDLMMPELDGFGVLEAMREKEGTRGIPVIVLTGQILTEKEMARLNRGVATVLGKGLFSVEETLSHVEAALARKRKLGSEARRLVRRAMAYIHEHYAETISREDVADHLGISGSYLSHCFRTEVGMTPVTYLNRYRVHQARLLLVESDKNMTEIALAVGFSDSGYFGRVFRRQEGVAPESYRKNNSAH